MSLPMLYWFCEVLVRSIGNVEIIDIYALMLLSNFSNAIFS